MHGIAVGDVGCLGGWVTGGAGVFVGVLSDGSGAGGGVVVDALSSGDGVEISSSLLPLLLSKTLAAASSHVGMRSVLIGSVGLRDDRVGGKVGVVTDACRGSGVIVGAGARYLFCSEPSSPFIIWFSAASVFTLTLLIRLFFKNFSTSVAEPW